MHSKAGTQFIAPIDNGVIFNFKLYFAETCIRTIKIRMARELQEHFFSKEYAKEFVMKGTKLEVIH